METLTEMDWREWARYPQTRRWSEQLRERMRDLQEAWLRGHFNSDSMEATALKNAEVLGRCRQLIELAEAIDDFTLDTGANNE